MKQIKNYSLIEKEFKNIDLNEEIKEAINYDNNDNMFDKLIEGKSVPRHKKWRGVVVLNPNAYI